MRITAEELVVEAKKCRMKITATCNDVGEENSAFDLLAKIYTSFNREDDTELTQRRNGAILPSTAKGQSHIIGSKTFTFLRN